MVGAPGFCLLYGGLASPFLDSGPVSRVRGILSIAGKARWVAGTYVHSDDQVGCGNDEARRTCPPTSSGGQIST